jgi:urease accessory protein
MTDLKFCEPDDVPVIFSAYDKKIEQLDVGKSGKVGLLRLKLEENSDKNKTIITDQYSQVPLYTQKALYYDENLPNMAHLFIMSPSGGILQGDRYRIDISLANNAVSHITTQGATRIYKMNSNYATQLININVGKNCYLEFIPDQIIPFRNSRYYQKVSLNVDPSATLIYSEIIVPGRVAMGELFSYDLCYLKTIGQNTEKKIKFIDNCMLKPKNQNMNTLGMFGNHTVLASVYILTNNECALILNKKINSIIKNNDEVSGGSTILPNNSGLLVRLMCNSSEIIKTEIYDIVRIVRKEILDAEFTDIRKT